MNKKNSFSLIGNISTDDGTGMYVTSCRGLWNFDAEYFALNGHMRKLILILVCVYSISVTAGSLEAFNCYLITQAD